MEREIKKGDQTMENKKRPTGLIVLAVINFIFAFFSLIGLLAFLSPQFLEQAGITITPYTILSPILTGALLIISGIGFIKVDYKLGFISGNIFGGLALVNIMIGGVILGKGLLIHIPSMIYPIVLLLLLNLRYKKYFAESK